MKTTTDIDKSNIRFRAIPAIKDKKSVDTYRMEVQTHTEIREAINLGIGIAIGFWFITLCPLSLIIWVVIELLG